jgi:hypothetical protein
MCENWSSFIEYIELYYLQDQTILRSEELYKLKRSQEALSSSM